MRPKIKKRLESLESQATIQTSDESSPLSRISLETKRQVLEVLLWLGEESPEWESVKPFLPPEVIKEVENAFAEK